MYILDENNNTLQKATVCTFKELNLEERKHLQEWIAAEPNSLGEDLLIIQKEFDGFADTKERLVHLTGEEPKFFPKTALEALGFTPSGDYYLAFEIKSLTPVPDIAPHAY